MSFALDDSKSPNLGDRVHVLEGAFRGCQGTVVGILEEFGLYLVSLMTRDQPKPVELEYWKVERI